MYSPFSLPNHILKNKKIILFGLLFAFLFFVPFISSAATLSLSPSSGNYNVGFGYEAMKSNYTGSYNTAIGNQTDIADGMTNSMALGNGAVVNTSNKIV